MPPQSRKPHAVHDMRWNCGSARGKLQLPAAAREKVIERVHWRLQIAGFARSAAG
jgi:hypothetical protein